MENNDRILNFHKITSVFRGFLGASEFEIKAICLLFLKYSMDNKIFTEQFNDDNEKVLSALVDLQTSLFKGYEIVPALRRYIVETFGKIKTNNFDFGNELYSIYEKIGMFDMTKDGKIFQTLLSIDLTNSREELLNYIDLLIMNSGRIGGEYSSNNSLVELSISLLKPSENDVCYDPFVGCGAFINSLPNNVKIYGNDISYNSLIISIIKCIISGKIGKTNSLVLLSRNDTFFEYNLIKADCIFADGPINVPLKNPSLANDIRFSMLGDVSIDSNIASILNAVYSLNDNGKAVITIPAGVLYKTTKSYVELRKYLVENNLIEAIIELPSMWNAISIQTYLLFISKNKDNDLITFVSSGTNEYHQFTEKKDARTNILTKEGIAMISDIVLNKKELSNVSKNVLCGEIEKESFNLSANRYIEKIAYNEHRPISEIDSDIKDVIEKIKNNLK